MLTKIIALLFKQQHWDNIELSELTRWKNQYPQSELMYLLYIKKKYFSTAEAKKKALTLQQSDEKEKETEQLYLFFDNPLWVQFLLSQKISQNLAPASLSSKKNKPVPKSSIKAISKEMLPSLLKDTQQKASELQHQKKRPGSSTAPKPKKATPQPVFSEEKKTPPPPSATTVKAASFPKKVLTIPQPPASEKPQSLVYWLKKSKKIAGGDALHYVEEKNEDTDIYTQTMAKLYEKQGKVKEAIQVYEKLILQNPSKNTLFAKKIETLKKKL